MGARHYTGRSDLLRALVARYGPHAGEVDAAVEWRLAEALSLHSRPVTPPRSEVGLSETARPITAVAPMADAEAHPHRPPLQARLFAILNSEPLAEPEDTDRPLPAAQALVPEDCKPRNPGEPPFSPLVGRTRLWPAVNAGLACARLGSLDVPALVRILARAKAPRRLPRRKVRNWGGELLVLVDVAHRLIPYEADYAQLLKEVRRLHGQAGISVRVVMESPAATLSLQRGLGDHQPADGPLPAPPPGTPVLILGDLGLLSHTRQAEHAWTTFCRRLADAGARPVAWVPCSSSLVSAEAARCAQVHCLGDGDLHPVKFPASVPVLPQAALDSLLTRIACCVRVEPALLRSLRRIDVNTAGEPGLEALLWSYAPIVVAGLRFCELSSAHQAEYRARFSAFDAATQAEILRRILDVHAFRGRSTESAEALLWQTHACPAALTPELAPHVQAARNWFARLSEFPAEAPGDLSAYASDLLARHGGDAAWLKRNSPALATLWALTRSEVIPAGLDSADIARVLRKSEDESRSYELVQRDEQLLLINAGKQSRKRVLQNYGDTVDRRNEAVVAWPKVEVGGGLEWSRDDGVARRWLRPGNDELVLPLTDDPAAAAYQFVSAGWRHRLGLFSRPSWALEWGRDKDGLYALAPSPLGEPVRLLWYEGADSVWPGEWPPTPGAFRAVAQPVSQGLSLGADLRHGLYLDVSFGSLVQRFRWIEPGEFWMGSPEGEPERDNDEGPRHVVRLTAGFWLADTACAQAVWQAVMGNNPSRFQDDPQNPVEQVSWDDVQDFLRRVEGLFPGLWASLPSEAEWEYACRAGSDTAFNLGESISPEQANYGGTKAYASGPTGEYRQRTVAVKHFEANAWGLYQMHGNVWEWCADGQRAYDNSLQVDPRGPDEAEAVRVVRGGSWLNVPRGLRSAYRVRWHRDYRYDYLGFRFSLRSTRPEEGAERQAGPVAAPAVGRAPGGRPRAEPARQEAGTASWLEKAKSFLGARKGDTSTPAKPKRKT
jgi:hypothetical protein